METLIQAFFRILMLRAGPQTIPPSATLMWLILLLHIAIGFLLTIFTHTLGYSLFTSLIGTLVMVAVVHGLLLLLNRRERYLQTITALAGCEVILGIMLLPLPINELYFGEDAGTEIRFLIAITGLVIVGWNVALAAHIFRHALSTSMGWGLLCSIGYFAISITVGDIMSGMGTPQ
ncbi:MAG: hypothetical protein OEZ16_01165 [Chromatiales bacterium]|nr:hypothetical protein [Chromatiales bacterium]